MEAPTFSHEVRPLLGAVARQLDVMQQSVSTDGLTYSFACALNEFCNAAGSSTGTIPPDNAQPSELLGDEYLEIRLVHQLSHVLMVVLQPVAWGVDAWGRTSHALKQVKSVLPDAVFDDLLAAINQQVAGEGTPRKNQQPHPEQVQRARELRTAIARVAFEILSALSAATRRFTQRCADLHLAFDTEFPFAFNAELRALQGQ